MLQDHRRSHVKMTWPVAERIEGKGKGATVHTDTRITYLPGEKRLKPKLSQKQTIEGVGSHFVALQPVLISGGRADAYTPFIEHWQESVAATLYSPPYFMGYLVL